MMTFNPRKLGGTPVAPQVSASAINQLLGMQAKSLDGAINALGDWGKANRTEDLNEMIAGGEFKGKTPEAIQALVAGVGSLNEQGNNAVAQMLKNAGVIQEQNFQTGERIAGQEHDVLMQDTRLNNALEMLGIRNKHSKDMQEDSQIHDKDMANINQNNKVKNMGLAHVLGLDKMKVQDKYNKENATIDYGRSITKLKQTHKNNKELQSIGYSQKLGAMGYKHKLTQENIDKEFNNNVYLKSLSTQNPLARAGIKQLQKNGVNISKTANSLIEYISDREDRLFDRDMDPDSRDKLNAVIMATLASPNGAQYMAVTDEEGRAELLYDEFKKQSQKMGYDTEDTFTLSNIFPGGRDMFERKFGPQK
jgi:hypothetical protein